jgi:hypothetical protein
LNEKTQRQGKGESERCKNGESEKEREMKKERGG